MSGEETSQTRKRGKARENVDAKLKKGHLNVKAKNVDMWNSHCYDVRQCALKKNSELERRCTTLCLFNKVPATHRSTSRRHLMECFSEAQDTVGSRITASMRENVFETWYTKDLAKDSH